MTKAIDILRESYATSRLNEAGRIADESGELLSLLNTVLRRYMAMGARVNRNYFGARLQAGYDPNSGGWPLPAAAEMVLRLEAGAAMSDPVIVAGTEIVLLPLDQRHIEPAKPAVYFFGGRLYPAGRATDPAQGTLILFAASAPAALTELEEELPSTWPRTFNSMLKWELAIYLAQKDGERDVEAKAFQEQLARDTKDFAEYLESLFLNEVRSYGHGGKFTSPRVAPR